MSDFLTDTVKSFGAVLEGCSNLLFLVRDKDLQGEAYNDLVKLDAEAESVKEVLIKAGNEYGANVMLAFQCAADSLAEELLMWLALKADDPEKAWAHLILAQEAAGGVVRTKISLGESQRRIERLLLLEKLLFPSQIFMSIGSVVHGADCSICGADYDQCSHIAGQPYGGYFCTMIPGEIEPDHVALVNEPADKRCRVAFFSDEGKKRNRMTWKLGSEDLAERTLEGILMAATGRWARVVFTLEMLQGSSDSILDKPLTSGLR
jgi:hypothetical protein